MTKLSISVSGHDMGYRVECKHPFKTWINDFNDGGYYYCSRCGKSYIEEEYDNNRRNKEPDRL